MPEAETFDLPPDERSLAPDVLLARKAREASNAALAAKVIAGKATQKELLKWRKDRNFSLIGGWAPCHLKLKTPPLPWPKDRRVRWHGSTPGTYDKPGTPLGFFQTTDGGLGTIEVRQRKSDPWSRELRPWVVICQGIEVGLFGRKAAAYTFVVTHLRDPVIPSPPRFYRRSTAPPRTFEEAAYYEDRHGLVVSAKLISDVQAVILVRVQVPLKEVSGWQIGKSVLLKEKR